MPRNKSRSRTGNLEDQLIKILKQNPEDGFETRRKRQEILTAVSAYLYQKYGLQHLRNLKPKHLHALIVEWKERGLSSGEIHNRVGHVRWLANKMGKTRMLPKSNLALGLERRERHTRAGKYVSAQRFEEILSKLKRAEDRLVVLMGRHFGMRFKEAALFRPHRDVDGSRIWIKRGTKGGKPRYLWIVTREQKELLEEVKRHVADKKRCLVDKDKTYNNWRKATYKRLGRAGMSRKAGDVFHDLRRTWADQEYSRLRAKGDPMGRAALIVAKRLGHNREEVLKWYLPGGAAA